MNPFANGGLLWAVTLITCVAVVCATVLAVWAPETQTTAAMIAVFGFVAPVISLLLVLLQRQDQLREDLRRQTREIVSKTEKIVAGAEALPRQEPPPDLGKSPQAG